MSEQHSENSNPPASSTPHGHGCCCKQTSHCRGGCCKKDDKTTKLIAGAALLLSIVALAVSFCNSHNDGPHHGWHDGPPMMQGRFMTHPGMEGGNLKGYPSGPEEGTPAPGRDSSR